MTPVELPMYIAGGFVKSDRAQTVELPFDGSPVATVYRGGTAHVAAAVGELGLQDADDVRGHVREPVEQQLRRDLGLRRALALQEAHQQGHGHTLLESVKKLFRLE